MRLTSDAKAFASRLVQVFDDTIRDRTNMTVRAPGRHHHGVGQARFVAEIDGEGVLGLHVVEAREDKAKGFLRARTRLGNRCGL
jgi:hypothetical protein